MHTITHLPKGCHLKSHTYTFLRFYSLLNWQLGIEMTFFCTYTISMVRYTKSTGFIEIIYLIFHKGVQIRYHDLPILWQYRLWGFQRRDTKLERFLAKNQLQSNEIIEF